MDELLAKWQLPPEMSEGNPSDDAVTRAITQCTVTVTQIPIRVIKKGHRRFFTQLYTIGNNLPIGHHELLASQFPLDDYIDENEPIGRIFLRWSTPRMAELFCAFCRENTFDMGDIGESPIRAEISKTAFRIKNLYNRRPNEGQIKMYKWVWWSVAPDNYF